MDMYDSTDPNAIPTTAPAVAGYLDGPLSQWPANAMQRFATGYRLFITTAPFPDRRADVCDCETFDATPAAAGQWAHDRVAAGNVARIYCNLSTWPQVQSFTQGIPVLWWIADPTGIPHMVPGATATQDRWASLGQTGGIANVDISTVNPSFFQGIFVLTQSEKYERVVTWAYAIHGQNFTTEADINAWASKIADDGSNIYDVLTQFRSGTIPPLPASNRDGFNVPLTAVEKQIASSLPKHTHPVGSTGEPVAG